MRVGREDESKVEILEEKVKRDKKEIKLEKVSKKGTCGSTPSLRS